MKILIVDDNEEAADSLGMLLEVYGYEVAVRYWAAQGLAEAERSRPDAILHDIAMPAMNGHEAVTRLRANPDFRGTLIVAISGYDSLEDRQQAKASGFDLLLVKPVDLQVLLKLLRKREGLQ